MSNSLHAGPGTNRFGAQRTKRGTFLGGEFDAAQSAPTDKLEGLTFTRFAEVQWVIDCPTGWCTSYDVHVCRWVEVLNDAGETLYGEWIEQDVLAVGAEDAVIYQYVAEQPLLVWVDNIVGVPDGLTFFRIVATGLNKGA